MPKFCKDCKHLAAGAPGSETCGNPEAQELNLVTGAYKQPWCFIVRMPGNRCGIEGVLFQQREPTDALPQRYIVGDRI